MIESKARLQQFRRETIDLHIGRQIEKLKQLSRTRSAPEKYRSLIRLALEGYLTEQSFRSRLQDAGLSKTHTSNLCSILSCRTIAEQFVGRLPAPLGCKSPMSFRDALTLSRTEALPTSEENNSSEESDQSENREERLRHQLRTLCKNVKRELEEDSKPSNLDCGLFVIQYQPSNPGEHEEIRYNTPPDGESIVHLDVELECDIMENLSRVGRKCGLTKEKTLFQILRRFDWDTLREELREFQGAPKS